MKNSEPFEYSRIEVFHTTTDTVNHAAVDVTRWERMSKKNTEPTFTNQKSIKCKGTKDIHVLFTENGQ